MIDLLKLATQAWSSLKLQEAVEFGFGGKLFRTPPQSSIC